MLASLHEAGTPDDPDLSGTADLTGDEGSVVRAKCPGDLPSSDGICLFAVFDSGLAGALL